MIKGINIDLDTDKGRQELLRELDGEEHHETRKLIEEYKSAVKGKDKSILAQRIERLVAYHRGVDVGGIPLETMDERGDEFVELKNRFLSEGNEQAYDLMEEYRHQTDGNEKYKLIRKIERAEAIHKKLESDRQKMLEEDRMKKKLKEDENKERNYRFEGKAEALSFGSELDRLDSLGVSSDDFRELKNKLREDGNEEAYRLMGEYEDATEREDIENYKSKIKDSVEEFVVKKAREKAEQKERKAAEEEARELNRLKELDKLPELEYSEIEKKIVDTYGKKIIAAAVRGSKLSSLNMDFELIDYEVVSPTGKNNIDFMVHLYPAKGLEADVTISINILDTAEVNSKGNIVKWVGQEDKTHLETRDVSIFGNFIENFERSGEKLIKGTGYTAVARATRYYVEGIQEVSKREKKAKEEEQQQLLAKEQASIQKAKEERAEKEKELKRQKDLEKIGVKPIDTKEGMLRLQRFEGLLKKNQESLKIQYRLVQDKTYGHVILVNIGVSKAPLRISPNFIMNGLTDEILYITSGKHSIRSGYNRVLKDYGIGLSKIKQRRYISKVFMMFEQANDLRRKV